MFIPGVNYHAFNHALRLMRFVKEQCPEFEFQGMEELLEDEAIKMYLEGKVDWDVTSEYIKGEEQKWLRKCKKYLLYDDAPWRVK